MKKSFKKFLCIVVVIATSIASVLGLSSCYKESPSYIDERNMTPKGIESFVEGRLTEVHLCACMPEDFFTRFEYIEAEAYSDGQEYDLLLIGEQIEFAYAKYNKQEYELAKNCLLEEKEWNEAPIACYGKYNFYESRALINGYNKVLKEPKDTFFPEYFWAQSCNDDNNTIVFIGMFIGNPGATEKVYSILNTNFGNFLKEYFPWYNFDE